MTVASVPTQTTVSGTFAEMTGGTPSPEGYRNAVVQLGVMK